MNIDTDTQFAFANAVGGYVDENGNGSWDADIGKSGNGGANDVVMYTVSVEYDPLFPNPFVDNGTGTRTL